jgi:hypothetical protein
MQVARLSERNRSSALDDLRKSQRIPVGKANAAE